VLVRVEVSVLISYLKAYVHGELPFYNPPKGIAKLTDWRARRPEVPHVMAPFGRMSPVSRP
jgi:hypothetical protein